MGLLGEWGKDLIHRQSLYAARPHIAEIFFCLFFSKMNPVGIFFPGFILLAFLETTLSLVSYT
jgi:hypothetical protein